MITDAFGSEKVKERFDDAKSAYAALGVDADAAITKALAVPVSLHCWQTDDVRGLEHHEEALDGGGILATGGYPGRARNGDEIRQDLSKVISLVPGVLRANVHALYAETGGARVDRDALTIDHFSGWLDWAASEKIGLDFNTTFFAHPKAADGFTLSHRDPAIREFWVAHGIACRRIAEEMGKRLGTPCTLNHWIPDGAKDSPADRWGPRARLIESYDALLDTKHGIDTDHCVDAVESKLFGLGSEDYVVGSFEFYSAYALTRKILLCLDMGHYHPTETIHDKLSALLPFHDRLLMHVSRPLRWDSDHVVIFNDDLRAVFLEWVRGKALDRALVAMDFFDASINRIAAYIIGARATRKAILYALLDPTDWLQEQEAEGKLAQKLAVMEECKTMPFDAVWAECCRRADVPVGASWLNEVETYEQMVLEKRS